MRNQPLSVGVLLAVAALSNSVAADAGKHSRSGPFLTITISAAGDDLSYSVDPRPDAGDPPYICWDKKVKADPADPGGCRHRDNDPTQDEPWKLKWAVKDLANGRYLVIAPKRNDRHNQNMYGLAFFTTDSEQDKGKPHDPKWKFGRKAFKYEVVLYKADGSEADRIDPDIMPHGPGS